MNKLMAIPLEKSKNTPHMIQEVYNWFVLDCKEKITYRNTRTNNSHNKMMQFTVKKQNN